MKIATWNVNSIRTRLDLVLAWLDENQPDLLCVQEIKCTDQDFPLAALEKTGWQVSLNGQKAYHGVAVISKQPIETITKQLPKMKQDNQARYLEVKLGDVRVLCLYAPNGNPVDSEKFSYKLNWLEALYAHVQTLLAREEKIIIAGDYNIIPSALDVWDETLWLDDALYHPKARALYHQLLWLGLTDAIATAYQGDAFYTFWNYQGGAVKKNHGIRIDHILLSPQAADCLTAMGIDKSERYKERPSDHVPVWIELAKD